MRMNPAHMAPALSLLYRLWVRSMRYEDAGGLERINACLGSGRPLLMALWHEELFPLIGYGMRHFSGRAATIVSDSRDGELIAQVLTRIGYATARGSSTRGGLKGLMQLKRHIEAGRIGAVTVDGPRGPRQQVKEGVVYLAARAGAVLLPMRAQASSRHVFERSWDHFQLPMPFCTCTVRAGEPLVFEAGKLSAEELAQGCRRLEQALHEALPPEG